MARIEPFEKHHRQYEDWFIKYRYIYESELMAVKRLIPQKLKGLEIGVGSGRFAFPLEIRYGVDPSKEMISYAYNRGIEVREGIAEDLPYSNSQFDFAVMITTVCFVDNINLAMKEANRILKSKGSLIIGFVDKNSLIGKSYQKQRRKSLFYKIATFYSVDEIIGCMEKAGFSDFSFVQTIFHELNDIKDIEPVKDGYGKGSFVVVKGVKQ